MSSFNRYEVYFSRTHFILYNYPTKQIELKHADMTLLVGCAGTKSPNKFGLLNPNSNDIQMTWEAGKLAAKYSPTISDISIFIPNEW